MARDEQTWQLFKCRLLPVPRIYVYLNMSGLRSYLVIVFTALEEYLFRNLRRSVSIRLNVYLKYDWMGREMMSVIGTLGVILVTRRPYLWHGSDEMLSP
jgi:hypothetical protein